MQNLFLAFAAAMLAGTPVMAEVPDSIVLQGRTTTPLATLSGTAVIEPSGFAQPFSAQADANGVFQFRLTGLSSAAFAGAGSTLKLQIGTNTVQIPFQTVPFAFRASQADSLASGATVQIVTIGTVTATTIIASSATFRDDVRVLGDFFVGNGTIMMGLAFTGSIDTNIIHFINSGGPAGGYGTIQADQDMTVQGQTNLSLNAKDGVASIYGKQSVDLRAQNGTLFTLNWGETTLRTIDLPAPNTSAYMMRLRSSGGQGAPFFHSPPRIRFEPAGQFYFDVGQNMNRDFVVEGMGTPFLNVTRTGNVGIGVTTPGAKLDVDGQVRIRGGGAAANRVLTSDANGLATWKDIGTIAENDGVIGNEVLGADGDESLARTGSGTGADPWKLKLNTGHSNTWTAAQTFNGITNFPLGVWHTNGNVGIGTTSPPDSRLEVNGRLKIIGGVPKAGRVLTALDDEGVTTWSDPAVLAEQDAVVDPLKRELRPIPLVIA